jgi:hypothetical protein
LDVPKSCQLTAALGAIGRQAFPKSTDTIMTGRNIMNRRSILSLTTMTLLALVFAMALPQPGLAQSNPWLGMWKLNLAKSTYAPGQTPRSSTYNFQGAGSNLTNTVETVDAAGGSIKTVNPHVYDGQIHPITGNPDVDTRMYTRVDANTVISASMKAGKLVQVTTIVLSQDGRTITTTVRGTNAAGKEVNQVAVYEKQ